MTGYGTLPLYLFKLAPEHRESLYNLCKDRWSKIEQYKGAAQQSKAWFEGKRFMMSGSKVAPAVFHGYEKFKDLKDYVDQLLAPPKPANKWMKLGTVTEEKARKVYEEKLRKAMRETFNNTANHKKDEYGQTYIMFHNRMVILAKGESGKFICPVIEVKESNFLIDRHMPWRGSSPDAIVFINGIAAWPAEIKCPQAHNQALYILWKLYYYDQLQNEMHVVLQHYPTCSPWIDTFVYSEKGPSEPNTFHYDAQYFWTYYFPLECVFFYKYYLPRIASNIECVKSDYPIQKMEINAPTPTLTTSKLLRTFNQPFTNRFTYRDNHEPLPMDQADDVIVRPKARIASF